MKGQKILGEKILKRVEMSRVEALSIQEKGESEGALYMNKAGFGITQVLLRDLQKKKEKNCLERPVILLCGPGNNGGDAFVVGQEFIRQGKSVKAFEVENYAARSPLCAENRLKFTEMGGEVTSDLSLFSGEETSCVVDALFGSGFKGLLSPVYQELVRLLRESNHKVYSIDIPSGLSEEALQEEESGNFIIQAEKTIYLGCPKEIFFFEGALEYCGELERVGFGLPEAYLQEAKSFSHYLSVKHLKSFHLPELNRTAHKHELGTCFLWAGSQGMPGAGVLSARSAYRSGGRLVRLCNTSKDHSYLSATPEVIPQVLSLKSSLLKPSQLLGRMNGHHAVLVGPGIGLSPSVAKLLRTLVPRLTVPVVLDADALTLFAKRKFKLPGKVVMTPHLGELARLLGKKERLTVTKALLEECQSFCQKNSITLVIKGAPTFILSGYSSEMFVYAEGDPGLSTAGSGDVLAGMITAFLAQGLEPFEASSLAVVIHGEAGRQVARKKTSYSLIASDLIKKIPKVLRKIAES